ncbi:MAG: cytochrome c biogenesis ATP-binding export protein CcmA [Lysobacteraceae bacterium]|nr:MAG: cytochrome c biogenesis ATP-binding export protein CcmA [Xanthomonadaceae bacterium]
MIEAIQIEHERNGLPIYQAVSFRIEAGQALLIEGGNGVGKTTLLRQLAGILPTRSGRVLFDGSELDEQLANARSQLLYLGHRLGITDDLSCQENARLWQKLWGRQANQDIVRSLQSVGLMGYEQSRAADLSAGQRKRLALSRLLLCPARLWLLDEPYSNLDADGLALVNRMLASYLERGGAAILTSHGTFDPGLRGVQRLVMRAA